MKTILLTFPLCLFALSACQKKEEKKQGGRPPTVVRFVNPVQKKIIAWDEYTGRLEAVEQVDVRARVGGKLESVNFTDGQLVKKGDLLFTIDREPYEAKVAAAKADLAQAEAERELAKANADRGKKLLERNAIAKEDVDIRSGKFVTTQAKVQAEQARLDSAGLDLGYTEVRAPISGRISDRYVTEGNLISGGSAQSSLLTTIVSVDPIYCRIEVDEASVLKYMRMTQDGNDSPQRVAEMKVEMGLGDDEGFPRKGKIDFVDNRMDAGTATLRTRAIFDNKDGLLTPGMFAKVRLPGRGEFTATLVPEVAIQTQQDFTSLLTVGEDDKVKVVPVKIGPKHGDMRVIEGDLPMDTRVIVSGINTAFPGAKVQPKAADKVPAVEKENRKTAGREVGGDEEAAGKEKAVAGKQSAGKTEKKSAR